MQDSFNGWGITENDVLRTRDGGISWFAVTAIGLTGIDESATAYFLDISAAWLLIPDLQNPSQGTLYHTVDAGESWQQTSVPFSGGYFDFISPTLGWNLFMTSAATGSSSAQLFKTTDGRESWGLVSETDPGNPLAPENLPFSGSKTGIGFFDEQRGWLTGSVPVEGVAYLYATSDGGKTWHPEQVSLPSGMEQDILEVQLP